MDVGTGLALLGSAKLAEKVFGPTAEYFGQGLRSFTENRIRNVKSIFEKAAAKVESIDESRLKSPASPLIANTIFEFGSYNEDSLVQDYLASLLISSRTSTSSDDRAAVFGNVLKSLTVLQVRTHYLMYTAVRFLYCGSRRHLGHSVERENIQTYISIDLLNRHVFLLESEREDSEYLLNSILHGLWRNHLIEQSFANGSVGNIGKYGPPVPARPGILFQPSAFGIELFLWINLVTERTTPSDIIDPARKIVPIQEFEFSGDAFKLPE